MVMSIRKTTYIHKSRSNKKELPSAVDDAADVMSKYSKNKRKNTSLNKKSTFPPIDYENPLIIELSIY